MVNKYLQDKRNKLMYEDYADMFFNKSMREDVILKELSQKYFVAESTAYRIILKLSKPERLTESI